MDGNVAERAAAAARQMTREPIDAKTRLIVALNPKSIPEAQEIVDELDGLVTFFKVGLQLQMLEGAEKFIDGLLDAGKQVFADYKYFDIPETVAEAVERAAKRRISFLTVHGNGEIIKAAVAAKGSSPLKIFAVTVLTSLDDHDLKDLFGDVPITAKGLALLRATKAIEYDTDGVICSPREAAEIRALPGSRTLLVATPGVRRDKDSIDDHKRFDTPRAAIMNGADFLIIGRPIIYADNRRAEAQDCINEMQAAFDAREQLD